MKVTFEFDPEALDDAQRSLLRELLFGEPVCQEEAVAETRDSVETAMAFVRRTLDENGGRVSSAELLKAGEAHSISGNKLKLACARMDGEFRVENDGNSWVIERIRSELKEFAEVPEWVFASRDCTEMVEPSPTVDDAVAIGEEEEFLSIRVLKNLMTPVAVISDNDLHAACSAKMTKSAGLGRLDRAAEIRALIRKYVQTEGQGVSLIPQSVRADFLEKLAAL